MRKIPKRLLVIGGGVIGLELGMVYQSFGSELTVVELTNSLLPGIDPDCTRTEALKAWDKVFNTDFFSSRADTVAKAASGPAILTSGLLRSAGAQAAQAAPVRKEGGGRYA